MFGTKALRSWLLRLDKEVDKLQNETDRFISAIQNRHKVEDCKSSGKHNPTYFIRKDVMRHYCVIVAGSPVPTEYRYVFMCPACRQEYVLLESELSPAQRQILVAMGEPFKSKKRSKKTKTNKVSRAY
jgi:hypothetical protein